MNVQELLDELRYGILHDRSDRISGSSDYLWTDQTLARYINEAQRRFAKRGLVIRDATTAEVVNVAIEAGITQYDLHPSVLAVISARIEDETTDLGRVGHSLLDTYRTPTSDVWDLSEFSTLPPGKPLCFTTDEAVVEDDNGSMSTVSMRLYPEPSSDWDAETIKLRVIRMPLEDITINDPGAYPEIPTDHHLEMLDWAAYLALRIVDDDAGNPKRAAEFANSFEAHVVEARNLVMRKLFAPQPWGFGRGGWSWGCSHG